MPASSAISRSRARRDHGVDQEFDGGNIYRLNLDDKFGEPGRA